MAKKEKKTIMNQDNFQKEIAQRLTKYENRNFLEQYGIYMGMTQILELGLKKLLTDVTH